MSPPDLKTRRWVGTGLLALAVLLTAARLRPPQAPPGRARLYTRAAHLMGSHFTFTAVFSNDSLACAKPSACGCNYPVAWILRIQIPHK